ncbi:hypothetical protein L6R52_22450 [Myxococcota bacterium]|nr:hypothetical protein [Myxococcota bacterium]
MTIALLAALFSVALGAVIGLVPGMRTGAIGRVRTFALIAAVTVVLGHLLPEAAHELGPLALVLVVLGVLLPTWLEEAMHRLAPLEVSGWVHSHEDDDPEGEGEHASVPHTHAHPHAHEGAAHEHARAEHRSRLGLEIGYAGLVAHHIGDGVALREYGSADHASLDVVLALAAHTVPVIAVVVLQFTALRGRTTALARAAGLFLATVVGISLASIFPAALEALEPWIAALVSGLLLHVIAHDLSVDPPTSTAARATDLLAGVAGLVLPIVTTGELDLGFMTAFTELLKSYAPLMIVGLAISATLAASRVGAMCCPPRRVLLEAQALGARSPLVAAAMALAGPVLRVELLPLAVVFLGVGLTLVWVLAAVAIAFAAAFVIARLATPSAGAPATRVEPVAPGVLGAADAIFHHVGPWMLIGMLASVYVDVGLDRAELAMMSKPWVALAVVTIVALPSYLASASAIPIAAALVAKGVPAAPMLAGLLLGPMIHVGAYSFLTRSFGRRAALTGSAVLVACVWVVSIAVERLAPTGFGVGMVPERGAPPFFGEVPSIAAAVLLGVLALATTWRIGIRRWIAGLSVTRAQAMTDPR